MRRVLAGMLGIAILAGVVALTAEAAKRRPVVKAKLTAFRSCPDLVAYGRRYASSNASHSVAPSPAVSPRRRDGAIR